MIKDHQGAVTVEASQEKEQPFLFIFLQLKERLPFRQQTLLLVT